MADSSRTLVTVESLEQFRNELLDSLGYSDRHVVLDYLNCFSDENIVIMIESLIESYPESYLLNVSWAGNTCNSSGDNLMSFIADELSIGSGVRITGQLDVTFTGTVSGSTIAVTGYRFYSESLTFSGGDKTITVTDLDVSGGISGSFTVTMYDGYIGSSNGMVSSLFEPPSSGSFRIPATLEYTI